MPPAGFEPAISAGDRPQNHALGRAATGTGNYFYTPHLNHEKASVFVTLGEDSVLTVLHGIQRTARKRTKITPCLTSACRRSVKEIHSLLELYAAYNDSFFCRRLGSTFLAYFQGSSSSRVYLTPG